jgi:hypothetical protein
MSDTTHKIQRSILPIPDRAYVGLTTYDAKDADTTFPPIEPLWPPTGAPNDSGPRDNEFSGQVNWVQLDVEKDDHDHLISSDERFKIAMTRQ